MRLLFKTQTRNGTVEIPAVAAFNHLAHFFVVHRPHTGANTFSRSGYNVSHFISGLRVPLKIRSGQRIDWATHRMVPAYRDPVTVEEAVKETRKVFKDPRNRAFLNKKMKVLNDPGKAGLL